MNKIYIFLVIIFSFSRIFSQTYTDVAGTCGINCTNSGNYGGGVSFFDFDKDGFDDLSITTTNSIPTNFMKNVTPSFQPYNVLGSTNMYKPDAVVWADFDNDGYEDVFICSFGGVSKLFHNNNNQGFTDVSASAGITQDSLFITGACWGDYDNDGYLDLYVCVYRAQGSMTAPNILYHNEHNGTFTNKTNFAGVQALTTFPFVACFVDYNNDGLQDIYVTSDRIRPNILYKNNGNGTFSDVSVSSHANITGESMGIAVGDYDNNGYLDMYISNGEQGNFLLKNNGNGTFDEVGESLGLGVYRICWGNNFLDYDNDGYLDIFVCTSNGAPDHRPYLFRNNGNGTFTRKTGIGLDAQHFSFGTAIGDINNDGYPDIGVVNFYDNFNLYQSSGGTNKWLKVKLVGNVSNRDGVGGVINVYRGGTKYMRPVLCGQSYLSQNSLTQMIGLGTSNAADSVVVNWPSGWKSRLDNVNSNQTITINENAPIGIIHNTHDIPTSFNLAQNYPNPFNPSTRIQYSIPRSELVKLEVFDLLGNKITELVNERKSAGTYEVSFDAAKLSSAVYFYKLTAGDFIQTNKMILVK